MGKMILGLLIVGVSLFFGIQWLKRTDMAPKDHNPVGYAVGLKKAEDKARTVMHEDNTIGVRDAVEKYRIEKNELPPDLPSLVTAGYIDRVPQGVSYDPATGQVSTTP